MFKKNLVLLMLVLAILLVGCSSADEQENDDWQTYTNDQYGYSFEFPSGCFYGPMPGDCKQKPPEERAPECLCFLNGEDPDNVFFQKIEIGEGGDLPMASFSISYYDSPEHNPPADAELVSWVEENWAWMFEDDPETRNTDIGGVPALEVVTPQSTMAPSTRTIFFIKADKLFSIYLIDSNNETSNALYDKVLSSFIWEE